MANDEPQPTRWDLTPIYPGWTRRDYQGRLCRSSNPTRRHWRNSSTSTISAVLRPRPRPTNRWPTLLKDVLEQVDSLAMLADRLDNFLQALVATDSYNSAAQRELSKLERVDTRRRQLRVRLEGWIGSLDPVLGRLIDIEPELAKHRFYLTDTAKQSRYLMGEDLEGLAAELCLDAGAAFGKLQGNITSQLKVAFERDGKAETLPITVIRNLSFDRDAAVRRRAYEVELKGWESIRTPVAAGDEWR